MAQRMTFERWLEVAVVGMLLISLFAGFAAAAPTAPDTNEERVVCVNEQSGEAWSVPADFADTVEEKNKNVDCGPTPTPEITP